MHESRARATMPCYDNNISYRHISGAGRRACMTKTEEHQLLSHPRRGAAGGVLHIVVFFSWKWMEASMKAVEPSMNLAEASMEVMDASICFHEQQQKAYGVKPGGGGTWMLKTEEQQHNSYCDILSKGERTVAKDRMP